MLNKIPVGEQTLIHLRGFIQMTINTHSPQQTQNLAKKIARKLKGGEVIALKGDLGGGKTTFTQGLAKVLGIKKQLTSPTFVIMKIYDLPKGSKFPFKRICHVDAYRLQSEQDLINIGVKEYLGNPEVVTVIEWADKVKKVLPKKTIKIYFEIVGETERKIELKGKT